MKTLCRRDTLMANNQLDSETLRTLYKDVKLRTSNNFTYTMGSHVMQYGNLKISGETLDGWLEESLSRTYTRGVVVIASMRRCSQPCCVQCMVACTHPETTHCHSEHLGAAVCSTGSAQRDRHWACNPCTPG